MFLLLAPLALSSREKPVVFFPPMFGSVLYGTLNNLKSEHWFCPRNLKDTWIWETDQYLISPLDQCMADYLTCAWNETMGKPWSRPEAVIYTIDFGGDQGIRYLDRGIFGYHIVHCLDVLLERFEKGGYVVRIDMYGAPYDWRLNPFVYDFYNQAKSLVELVNLQCQHKATLIGYSAGCLALHFFLARTCDQEWKDQFVDKIVMVAPSYGGGLSSPAIAWTGESFFPMPPSESITKFTLSVPTMYAHMPNIRVYGDKPIIKGPNGELITAGQLREFQYSMGKVPEEFRPIWDYTEKELLSQDISDPGVDAIFVINTALDTRMTMIFNETWDEPVGYYDYEEGDTVLNKDTLLWGCNHWKSGHSVVCHDYRLDNLSYSHGTMLGLPDVRDDIYHHAVEDDWRIPGNFVFEGPRRPGWTKRMQRIE